MIFSAALAMGAAVVSTGTAAFVLLREKSSFVRWALVSGLLLLAAESLFSSLSLHAVLDEDILMWQRFRLLATSLVPSAWLLFSLSYARGNYRFFVQRWRVVTTLSVVLPATIVLVFWRSLFAGVFHLKDSGIPVIRQNASANLIHIVLILVAVMTIMNLERTLRAATGTMRWRIKFMVIGVVMLLATKIYISTQVLLYSSIALSLDGLNAGMLLLCQVLILRSLLRSQLLNIDLYPSQYLLYHSFTAILAGIYLLAVGTMAHLATRYGLLRHFPLKSLILFAALIGLSILAISDRVRQSIRWFVSRQFGRPMYDCRKVWTDFTNSTTSSTSAPALSHAVATMVSDTFEVLSVTIWLVDETQKRLIFGASTSLAEKEAAELIREDEDDAQIIKALQNSDRPLDLDHISAEWAVKLKRCNPLHFPNRGEQLVCVPLSTGEKLIGVMVLADRVRGVPYSSEEMDLLKTIGDQVGGKLLNIRLSARLLEAKQMEAFQAMSAFFVHDLKNTSSTLSLMLQNLPKHFGNPTFRQDALAAISQSVNKINDLISRLTTLRQNMDVVPVETDLNKLVQDAVSQWNKSGQLQISQSLTAVPRVTIDPEQIQKVLTNLFLNARDAIGEDGSILVETGRRKEWVFLTVKDTGHGMSREFIANSLFRPFKSTKQAGMGIGLFHSKMIVEAHHGRLELESKEGEGSTFRILLPLREDK